MSLNRNYHRSIISAPEPETSSVGVSIPQCSYNKPLINSAMTSAVTSNEEIIQQHQEPHDSFSSMDVDLPSEATASGGIDLQRLEVIDNDAVIARQLQEEEYSRQSLTSFRPPRRASNNGKHPSPGSNPYGGPSFNDAELAAQLQAEENQSQTRQRSRMTDPSHRRIPQQNDTPQVIRSPVALQQRPPSTIVQPSHGGHRAGGHRSRNLQNTTDDFGPNDYENLLELDRSLGNKPLSSDAINQLPIEQYHRRAQTNEEDNKCNICWDDFEENPTLRRLKCLHLYHKDCIDRWFKTRNFCPICRMATD